MIKKAYISTSLYKFEWLEGDYWILWKTSAAAYYWDFVSLNLEDIKEVENIEGIEN